MKYTVNSPPDSFMTFTEENIKYCLLTFDQPFRDHIKTYAEDRMCISGLYQWAKIFKGDFNFPVFSEDTEKYNLIHVNVTPRNIPLLSKFLPMVNRNTTKLIFNVDHSIHLWNSTFPYPQHFLEAVDKADYVFGVERCMCETLSDALKRKVGFLPHPVDVVQISKHRKEVRDQRIGVSIHRYIGNTVLPWYALNELPRGWVTSAIGANASNFQPKIHHMYPEVQPYLKFEALIEYASSLYAVLESYFISSYGRFTAECAALGVPVVGSDIVGSQGMCFPDIAVANFQPVKMKKLVLQLINDKAFYTSVVKKATERVQFYSLENCKKRMLEFVNGTGG